MLVRSLYFHVCAVLSVVSASAFPSLTYSTYLRHNFTPKAIATDASGNVYIAGSAVIDPATSQTAALVLKLNPSATQSVYVRYLAGSRLDSANAIAVDAAGNAYVTGYTQSPDFPVTAGNLGNPPAAPQYSRRTFVAKLDPNGQVVFSTLLGGSATSAGNAVAVTPTGQIIVSGAVTSINGDPPFPSTPGAYKSPNTIGGYLLELDPTGAKVIFSALGIGGSALALDAAGNIYVAGTTTQLDYPTTPGAYQTTFPAVRNCSSPDCAFPLPGTNQYVTKIDSAGSKLIYSTAVTGTRNTVNGGLAVDSTGNAYITGYAGTGYPYTVNVPTLPVEQAPFYYSLPFLSKLDPTGQSLVFSVPAGGAGVQVDSGGAVYVAGNVGRGASTYSVPAGIPALASLPGACLPPSSPGGLPRVAAYSAQLDAVSGNLLGSRFIGGSTLRLSGVALSRSTLWIAGATDLPDFPFTPETPTVPTFELGSHPGSYLGAVDFSQPQPPAGAPQIGCLADSATMTPAGPAARYQLVTIFGSGLGPAAGLSATDDSTTQLGGVHVSFGSTPASLLYVSSSQINFAVPLLPSFQSSAAMQVTVDGVSAATIGIPLTRANPGLFSGALNPDGSQNSAQRPATLGSMVSVFLNGLNGLPLEFLRTGFGPAPLQIATDGGWSIRNVAPSGAFVLRVDLQVPSKLSPDIRYCPANQTPCSAPLPFDLFYFDPYANFPDLDGRAIEGTVYVTVAQ